MIRIELPEMDFDIPITGESAPAGNHKPTYDKYYQALVSGIPWKKGGVYFLCTDDGPVYIGRSVNMNQRITCHLTGNEGTTSGLSGSISRVKGFFEPDICNQEIYESYAIKIYQPILNKAKTERVRNNYGAAKPTQV